MNLTATTQQSDGSMNLTGKLPVKSWLEATLQRDEVDSIKEVVFDYFNIPLEECNTETRKREIVQARQISMFFAKSLTKASLSHIGFKIGGKDHATVLHACKNVNNLCETDKSYRDQVKEIGNLVSKFTAAGDELYYNRENGRHYNLVQKIQNIRDEFCWIVKDARRIDNDSILEASDVLNIRKITKVSISVGRVIPIKKAYYVESLMREEKFCETWHIYTLDNHVITITFPHDQVNEYLISEEII